MGCPDLRRVKAGKCCLILSGVWVFKHCFPLLLVFLLFFSVFSAFSQSLEWRAEHGYWTVLQRGAVVDPTHAARSSV